MWVSPTLSWILLRPIKDGSWLRVTSATFPLFASSAEFGSLFFTSRSQCKSGGTFGRHFEGRTLIPSDLVSLVPSLLPVSFSWSMYFARTQRFTKLQIQASRVASLLFLIGVCLSCCPMIRVRTEPEIQLCRQLRGCTEATATEGAT